MKSSKFNPVIGALPGEKPLDNPHSIDFTNVNAELRERFLDGRITDLELAFKTTSRLLNEPRWMGDVILTEACRRYRTELLDLKLELKALIVQKNESKNEQ